MIQIRNSPNLLESGIELQDAERCSKKPWIIITAVGLTLAMIFSGLMYCFPHFKDPENCWAQASLDPDPEAAEAWAWTKMPTFCMKQTGNQKLEITQNGSFLIYVQIKRKSKSNNVPFAIQLNKEDDVLAQSQSEEDNLVLLGTYHLNEGEEISLNWNDKDFKNIEKNSTQTYWGILRIPSYNS
ncbi:tumor necrosis factor ligand superfamily member 18 [Notamacropus eugenii]|uniref:tumor necrosis factor ligand superfamily member 18 n=1 Tax=Notamacropus eugenii TaxID=9315 RepID=UPI003B67E81A